MQTFQFRGLTSNSRKQNATHLSLERLEERTVLSSWVEGFGGVAADTPDSSQAMDPHGNVYLSGSFNSQPADFDPGSGTTPSMSSAGGSDVFVAKYEADGSLAWARRFGGTATDQTGACKFASEVTGDYVYVVGGFQGTADFGAPSGTLKSAGGFDMFILKLNASTGATVWAERIGGKVDEYVDDVAVADGKVYVTGAFAGTVDFDPGPNTANLKGSAKDRHAFVLTLDSDGGYRSAWQIEPGSSEGWRLLVDGSSLYLIGYFSGTPDFDPGPAVRTLTSTSSADSFIARYTTTGALTWVGAVGAHMQSHGAGLSSDADSIYLVCSLFGTKDFDPGPGTAYLSSTTASYTDVVVAKYSKADGAYQWAKQFGGTANEYAATGVVDAANGVLYVGGYSYSGSVDFNPSAPGGEVTNAGGSDGFVLTLSLTSGDYQSVVRMGGTGYDAARVIGASGTNVYVQGYFAATADFPTPGTLTSAGDLDTFLMALDQAPAAPSGTLSAAATSSLANDLALLSIMNDLDGSPTGTAKKRL